MERNNHTFPVSARVLVMGKYTSVLVKCCDCPFKVSSVILKRFRVRRPEDTSKILAVVVDWDNQPIKKKYR